MSLWLPSTLWAPTMMHFSTVAPEALMFMASEEKFSMIVLVTVALCAW